MEVVFTVKRNKKRYFKEKKSFKPQQKELLDFDSNKTHACK